MTIRLSVCLLLVCVTARADEPTKPTATASEKNPAVPAAGHSLHGEAFNDGPRQRAYLMNGQGKVSFPVTTRNPEAQKFINQGVAQLHSFFYFEAERSFRQAALLDPSCPMADWGMAMANVNNERRAKGFLKTAEKKAQTVKLSRREQLYLDALAALYKEGGNDKARKSNYLLGLETIVQDFPDDIDARAWMAMVTWQNEGQSGIGSRQAVDMVLDTVMAREPMHPGAHHYRIHLWDGSKVIRAEKSATIYAKTAPGIAHAWHMPGHTFTNLKRYADAAYQQEGSARVDHAYMLRDRVMPFEIHNYSHNNQWLATSLSHIGRARDAIAVARNLVDQPRDPQKNGPNDGGSSQRSGRTRWVETLEKYELWDDLIAAATSGTLDWADIPAEQVARHHALGLAFAAKGDAAKLATEIAALRAIVEKETPKPDPKAAANPQPARSTNSAAATALAELEGYQLNTKGDYAAALERFSKATSMRPEALARAHLAAKNFGLAEAAAKKAVEGGPGQFLPAATFVDVLNVSGKPQEALKACETLAPLARQADRDTPIFRRIEPVLTRWLADSTHRTESLAGPDDDAHIPLSNLGPLVWSPNAAEPISLIDTDGKPWSLAEHKGRNVVVIFFLGGKCPHCMQQLQEFGKEFEALKKLNTDVVAISTDDLESSRALKTNKEGVKFPMPILADPKLDRFHAYRAHDDFENVPLHGTFLIDAKGFVRFQRISADPFLDVDFIKKESARVSKF
jgi:peroxiredoxin/tetratricopeptide (TPR) repeat protein